MEDTPDDHIHEIFSNALWPDHPIGLPILGSRETVGGFDHAQSVAFRAQHYLTGNCVVAAAGNVDHDELVALAEAKLCRPRRTARARCARSHTRPAARASRSSRRRPSRRTSATASRR